MKKPNEPPPFRLDIIGDVHGEYDQLVRLLTELGYTPQTTQTLDADASSALWRHPNRKAVFVGDLIDRGPQAPQVLRLVKTMVESGQAWSILGNHEFNAIAHTIPDDNGGWLRPRTLEKIGAHQITLNSFHDEPEAWKEYVDWFKTLPTSLDFGGLRVVHAAWHPEGIIALRETGAWTVNSLQHNFRSIEATALREGVLNGPEIALPPGLHVYDAEDRLRTQMRVAWWELPAVPTWADLVFPRGTEIHGTTDRLPGPLALTPYDAKDVPVIFGHYALPPHAPGVQATNIACIDFGCGKRGALGAYRWDGEAQLDERKIVRVFAKSPTQKLTTPEQKEAL